MTLLHRLPSARSAPSPLQKRLLSLRHASTQSTNPPPPIVSLQNAKIYADYPKSETTPPLLSISDFSIASHPTGPDRRNVAVISPSSPTSHVRTNFLKSLQGEFICIPPTARSWPYLSSDAYRRGSGGSVSGLPSQKIGYVGFSNSRVGGAGGQGTQGAYLSARYESRVEVDDWSLRDYLTGNMGLNLTEEERTLSEKLAKRDIFHQTIRDLRLEGLLRLPVSNLSNGQTRRARIAKALLAEPELLLLDEPFVGLDPLNHQRLAQVLEDLIHERSLRVMLSLQANEPIPYWVTDLVELNAQGEIHKADNAWSVRWMGLPRMPTSRTRPRTNRFQTAYLAERAAEMAKRLEPGERWNSFDQMVGGDEPSKPLVDMEGVQVSYGKRCVLGNWRQEGEESDGLHWTVRQGDRWAIFGANGSGKTTIISLLTSDHPQSYSLPIKIFGKSRLPESGEPGISLFDIQSRIGHSSPEVHTHFPKSFTLHQVLESAWSEAFYSRPKMTHEDDQKVAAALKWFRLELDPSIRGSDDILDKLFASRPRHRTGATPRDQRIWEAEETAWADEVTFGRLGHQAQKVALFLRAVIKKPDIVILDEAFSGMDERCRVKCMLWLAHGQDRWLDHNTKLTPQSSAPRFVERRKVDTTKLHEGRITFRNTGLEPRQALVCVSHRPEEIPFVVDKWMLLPEPNEGQSEVEAAVAAAAKRPSVRYGKVDLSSDPEGWWDDMWRS